jgi:hypothetical protein
MAHLSNGRLCDTSASAKVEEREGKNMKGETT